MTAQINDTFLSGDIDYSVAGISEGELFDPAILDLNPSMAEIREMVIDSRADEDARQMPTQDEIRVFVERAFDGKYRL